MDNPLSCGVYFRHPNRTAAIAGSRLEQMPEASLGCSISRACFDAELPADVGEGLGAGQARGDHRVAGLSASLRKAPRHP